MLKNNNESKKLILTQQAFGLKRAIDAAKKKIDKYDDQIKQQSLGYADHRLTQLLLRTERYQLKKLEADMTALMKIMKELK